MRNPCTEPKHQWALEIALTSSVHHSFTLHFSKPLKHIFCWKLAAFPTRLFFRHCSSHLWSQKWSWDEVSNNKMSLGSALQILSWLLQVNQFPKILAVYEAVLGFNWSPCCHLRGLFSQIWALQSSSEVLREQEGFQPCDVTLLSILKWQRYIAVAVNSEPLTIHMTSSLLPLAPSTSPVFFCLVQYQQRSHFCKEMQHCAWRAHDTHPTGTHVKTPKAQSKPFSYLAVKTLLLPHEQEVLCL